MANAAADFRSHSLVPVAGKALISARDYGSTRSAREESFLRFKSILSVLEKFGTLNASSAARINFSGDTKQFQLEMEIERSLFNKWGSYRDPALKTVWCNYFTGKQERHRVTTPYNCKLKDRTIFFLFATRIFIHIPFRSLYHTQLIFTLVISSLIYTAATLISTRLFSVFLHAHDVFSHLLFNYATRAEISFTMENLDTSPAFVAFN